MLERVSKKLGKKVLVLFVYKVYSKQRFGAACAQHENVSQLRKR
jgi:hypothetical protein